jgi:hypothetical protein
MERKGAISPWVVALVHLSYEDVREKMEESVRKNFGVAEAQEVSTKGEDFKAVDLHVPQDPMFGEGFGSFRELAPGMTATREYTIVSKGFIALIQSMATQFPNGDLVMAGKSLASHGQSSLSDEPMFLGNGNVITPECRGHLRFLGPHGWLPKQRLT